MKEYTGRNKGKQLIALWIVFLYACTGNLFAQSPEHRNRQIDSLEQVLATRPPAGAELVRIYRELMYFYVETNTKKSMNYARKCIETAISLNKLDIEVNGYNVLGRNFYKLLQYDSALVYYEKALERYEQMRDYPETYKEKVIDIGISTTYGNIGNLYNMQGKNHQALEFYQKVLPIFEKYDEKAHLTLAYLNIGELYRGLDNIRQAEINFSKMDSLAQINSDSLFIAYAKYSLGSLYTYTKAHDKALQNAEIAYTYFSARPEEAEWVAILCCLFANIYLNGYGDDKKAEEYARQATQIFGELGLPNMALNNFSQIYLKRKQWDKATQAALTALEADDSDPHNNLAQYKVLAMAYAQSGDAGKAKEYLDKLIELQSSWSNKNYQSSLSEMEVRYETEKKEMRITTLEEERKLIIWLGIASIAVLLLLLTLFAFLWQWSVHKKRTAEERIEQEKRIVATQALLDGETAERTRLARDLHDGLGSMLTGIKLSLENMRKEAAPNNLRTKDFNTSLNMLGESMKELRRIAHHLMPETLQKEGLKSALTAFCQSLPVVQFGYLGSEERVDAKMEVMIYRIIHELVNNALKHSGASQIWVQVMREADYIAFTVRDNGCGFNPSAETKGMGLRNIRDRVASYNGRLLIDSRPGEGTEININFTIETHGDQ